jgi:peptide/nickel transport system permease protein
MKAYIIRRLLLIIPTLFVTSLIVFLTIRLVPGSVIEMMASQGEYFTKMDRASIEHALGLDVPLHVQYWRWIGDIIMHGDLGTSLWRQTSVTTEVISAIPVTFELGLMAMLVGLIIAMPIGVYSAIRQDTIGDYIGRSFAILFIAVPGFWLGTMIVVFPSLWWGWSPPIELIPFDDNPLGNLRMFIIPAVVLGMSLSGVTMIMMRTMLLEELQVYWLDQVPYIVLPVGYSYCYAWPWVKNYYGEIQVGCYMNAPIYARIWIDRELKKEMGY